MMVIWIAATSYFFKGIQNANGDMRKIIFNLAGFLVALAAGGLAYMFIVGR